MNRIQRQRKILAISLLILSIVLGIGALLQSFGTILLIATTPPVLTPGDAILQILAEVSFLVIAFIVYRYARRLFITSGSSSHQFPTDPQS